MERVEIAEDFAASAGRVWTLLGDFEAMAALPGVPVETSGTGVGATRTIAWEGRRIVETLEAIDHIGYRFTYAVSGNLPLPARNLRSSCRLEPTGDLSCGSSGVRSSRWRDRRNRSGRRLPGKSGRPTGESGPPWGFEPVAGAKTAEVQPLMASGRSSLTP